MKKQSIDEQPNQTLAKAIKILDAFSAEQPERGIRELGRELGINPTTIYRLVATLCNAGYLERKAETQTYSLGPKVLKLASLYAHKNPLPAVARQVFESYSDRFEHNFYLAMLSHFEVIYLAVLDGRGPIKIAVEPGGSINMHSTALGKTLLAYQTEEYVQEFLNNTKLLAFTPRTISSPKDLRAQLCEIRQKGYAINDGEQYEDVGAIGIPILGAGGQANLAISLTYPRHLVFAKRIDIDQLIVLGREIAEQISARSGMLS